MILENTVVETDKLYKVNVGRPDIWNEKSREFWKDLITISNLAIIPLLSILCFIILMKT